MKNVVNKAVYSAYCRLKYVTPLKTDCGKMCDGECCKGDRETGMVLFPGEEKLFLNKEGYTVREKTDGSKLLVCNGVCDRKERPLSCRIYPLFPYTYIENCEVKQKVIYDVRGMNSCPIVNKAIKTDKKFVFAVRLAGKELLKDEECSKQLLEISREIDEIIEINEKLGR